MNVKLRDSPLTYTSCPTYLGVKLDRQLTFNQHLTALCAKISARNCLLRRLAGCNWGAGATTLRTSALALVFSAAEYAAPVWCNSRHSNKVDTAINETLRIITGCLRPTKAEYLPVLAGIMPADLRRLEAARFLALKATAQENHLLHQKMDCLQNPPKHRLKSRRPFTSLANKLSINHFNPLVTWRQRWDSVTKAPWANMLAEAKVPPEAHLPRKEWVTLNRIKAGVGRNRQHMKKWGLSPSAKCDCSAASQTMEYLMTECDLHQPPTNLEDLSNRAFLEWLGRMSDID